MNPLRLLRRARSRPTRRVLAASAFALLALPAVAAPAGAADAEFTYSFDWTNPAHGYVGWTAEERDPGDQLTSGWYALTQGTSPWGDGLTIRPTGHGGDTYQTRRRGLWGYTAPGSLTIRQAVFSGVNGDVQDRQGLRFHLYRGQPPELPTGGSDFNANPVPATVTRTDPAALAKHATAWLHTLPCDMPNEPACQNAAANGANNHYDAAALTLVDHEAPDLQASGPGWDARNTWVGQIPTPITLTASDPGAGVQHVALTATQQATRTLLTHRAACDLTHTDATLAGRPCPAATPPVSTSRPAAARSGAVRLVATARDYAGQSTRRRWRLNVDREPPSMIRSSGLARLHGRFLPRRPPALPIIAVDKHSGIHSITARLRHPDGNTSTLTPYRCPAPAGRGCPRLARDTLRLDPGQLAEGRTTITLIATDQVGQIRSSKPTAIRVDRTGPRAPKPQRRGRVITWAEPHDPGGSGIAHYQYSLDAGDTWLPTLRRRVELRRKPTSIDLDRFRLRAVDRAGNRGKAAKLPVARAALDKGKLAERLRVEQGLVELERYANDAQRAAGRTGAKALVGALKPVAKVATKATIIATILDALVFVEDTQCDEGVVNRPAKKVFSESGDVLGRVANASPGAHPRLWARIASSRRALAELRQKARYFIEHTLDVCHFWAENGLQVLDRVEPAMKRADDRIVTLYRNKARIKTAAINRRPFLPPYRCETAKRLVKLLGSGPGRRNYVVYSVPPLLAYVIPEYVGISRRLSRRCSEYRRKNPSRYGLENLLLPPLTLAEARAVEEALIAHFGTANEARNDTVTPLGRLENRRHEHSPDNLDYCAHLLLGQTILQMNSYAKQAAAFYTRNRRCPGVGR